MSLPRLEKMTPKRLAPALAAAGLLLSSIGPTAVAAAEAALFGLPEIRSEQLASFTKWTGMLARLGAEAPPGSALDFVPADNDLAALDAVNRMVNAVRYVPDEENWGAPDHWATPGEFYRRNGDCEDFAIAKYVALKALGFDPAKMRIVVLVDEKLHKHHAVLMVDTENGRMILDNQIAQVVRDTDIEHYRPIYSINEDAWWLHVPTPRKRLIALRNP